LAFAIVCAAPGFVAAVAEPSPLKTCLTAAFGWQLLLISVVD
jgi:hypothetical protein